MIKFSEKSFKILIVIVIAIAADSFIRSYQYRSEFEEKINYSIQYIKEPKELVYIEHIERSNSEYVNVCNITSTKKTWMEYYKITDSSTRQFQQLAALGNYNHDTQRLIIESHHFTEEGILTINGRLAVAMDQRYGPIGAKYNIELSSGVVLPIVIAEFKHEDCVSSDGSFIEFLVNDRNFIKKEYAENNFDGLFKGNVIAMEAVK